MSCIEVPRHVLLCCAIIILVGCFVGCSSTPSNSSVDLSVYRKNINVRHFYDYYSPLKTRTEGIEELKKLLSDSVPKIHPRLFFTLDELQDIKRRIGSDPVKSIVTKNQPILSDPELEEISLEIYSGADLETKSCDDSFLILWCTGQDKCMFYYEFQEHKSKMLKHSETLFEAYKWPLRLGIPQTALYRAIVAFESKRGVSPGGNFAVSVDELASYIGAHRHRFVIRYLYDLKRFGLVEDYGLRDDSVNVWIRRAIPIPGNPKGEWA